MRDRQVCLKDRNEEQLETNYNVLGVIECVMCDCVSREENKTSCTSPLTGAVEEEIEQVSCSPRPLG